MIHVLELFGHQSQAHVIHACSAIPFRETDPHQSETAQLREGTGIVVVIEIIFLDGRREFLRHIIPNCVYQQCLIRRQLEIKHGEISFTGDRTTKAAPSTTSSPAEWRRILPERQPAGSAPTNAKRGE